jgi:hypothetical protein
MASVVDAAAHAVSYGGTFVFSSMEEGINVLEAHETSKNARVPQRLR